MSKSRAYLLSSLLALCGMALVACEPADDTDSDTDAGNEHAEGDTDAGSHGDDPDGDPHAPEGGGHDADADEGDGHDNDGGHGGG